MPLILDGRKARDFYTTTLIDRVNALSAVPALAIIQIGENAESTAYIGQKKKFGEKIGARVEHVKFAADVEASDVEATIAKLNARDDIHGIIIQLPLPAHLDKLALINAIDPAKDVDGLTDENQKLLEEGRPRFVPATAKGVMHLLDFYSIPIANKKAVVLGRSRLVGRPIAEALRAKGAHVTVCHSKTEDVPRIAKEADILVVAIGKPLHVDAHYIGKSDTVVVDVGINSIEANAPEGISKRKLVGDVDSDDIGPAVSAISPVPGGVGPMTVLSLFDNLVVSAETACRRKE
jgi:5,10-methylene-tetrahydrofolate dehydrogenase/methenyl tetrahydrofolate cyclohydrolase